MTITLNGTTGITYPDASLQATGNGLAKAWVNFNGTGTVAIRADYNVSSITDNGVGDARINFSTAFADANYSAVATVGFGSTAGDEVIASLPTSGMLTSSVRVTAAAGDGGARDCANFCVAVFR